MSTLDTNYFRAKLNLIIRDLSHYTPQEMARELARLAKAADETEAAKEAPSAPVAADERALLAARAEGRAEAVLIIQSTEPENALEDCLSHSSGFDGEYDTFWDEDKLRAKFQVGDATINMEAKAELAYYEYMGARMELEYEADQRRAALSVKAASTPEIPEGWKLVPIEPTEAMLSDVDEEVGGHCYSCSVWSASWDDCKRVYAALLAAAPTPPTTGEA